MTPSGEILPEAGWPKSLLTIKATTRIWTWNVRTMYKTDRAAQVASEMRRYSIAVLGICESRWNGAGRITLSTRQQMPYSGHEDEHHAHTKGVAFMLSDLASKALSRFPCHRRSSQGRKFTLINCYAPTNNAADEQNKNSMIVLRSHTKTRHQNYLEGT